MKSWKQRGDDVMSDVSVVGKSLHSRIVMK
jgi:hypothetical protein